jgi:Protein of unknown function (DUF2971)
MKGVDSKNWKREFVRLLEKATVANKLAERVFELKNLYLPETICRYRKDSAYSRGNLKDDTLWLCSPAEYNDPFDCQTKLIISSVESALARTSVRKFFTKKLRLSVLDAPPPKLERRIGESIETYAMRLVEQYRQKLPASAQGRVSLMSDRFARAVAEVAAEARPQFGMFRGLTKACSFSERNNSILMWSHYADNHQGFCVEYDIHKLSEAHEFRRTLCPIIYANHLYDSTPLFVDWIEKSRSDWNEFLPLLAFVHKAEDWSYEREWRLLFVRQKVVPDHAWSAPTPARIFLGARMKETAKKEIRELIGGKSIETHQMRMADDSFTLISERVA